jgi:hypothetical protein
VAPNAKKRKIEGTQTQRMKIGDKLLLPFEEVELAISRPTELAVGKKKGTENEIRLLEYCFSFAEYQYVKLLANHIGREEMVVENWNVWDIRTL